MRVVLYALIFSMVLPVMARADGLRKPFPSVHYSNRHASTAHKKTPMPTNGLFTATVTRIVDGDTVKMDGVIAGASIRMWGFDTPEHYQPKFFAAAALMETLTMGKALSCRVHDRDHYGRLVAQCTLPDGRDVGALMVASGLARDYTRYSRGYYKRFETAAR